VESVLAGHCQRPRPVTLLPSGQWEGAMEDECSIYVISHYKDDRFAKPIKVGIANDVLKRLGQFQTASAFELVLAHVFPLPNRDMARELEKAFHSTQEKHRLRGEWFDIEPLAAVHLMCMNIRSCLAIQTDLNGQELEHALTMCGVISAEQQLAKREATDGSHTGSHTHH
jgi:hypothetical protein